MGRTIIKSLPDMQRAKQKSEGVKTIHTEFVASPVVELFAKNKFFKIITHGCQANIRDEEVISGILVRIGFSKTDDINKATLIIINTCAVRENAEDKVYGELGEIKHLKEKNKEIILAVCGCMVQQDIITKKILKSYPYVDLIFGTHNLHELSDMLTEVIKNDKRLVNVISKAGDIYENLPSIRTNTFSAFVNIAYGCDKFCTYCIVPYTRGRQRSRKVEDILNEIRELKNNNYKEVTLLGQNVNAYGKDLEQSISFATLLDEVAKIGIDRVRFLTSHPWDFDYDIIEVVKKHNNIMKLIHLPVQSGNDEILKIMGRRYTSAEYINLVNKVRAEIPEVSITTDIIIGFPNETIEQANSTIELCKLIRYEGAYTFIYSPREGTPASLIKDNVTYKEKSENFVKLTTEIGKILKEQNDEMIGKEFSVLIDAKSDNDAALFSGRMENLKLVHVKSSTNILGTIVKVKIIDALTFYMVGELVDE